MKVSTQESFQVVYSLFEHEYLGYLFESFIVQLDDSGRLTLQHQNISALNAREFDSGLDDTDYELIDLMDSMQPEAVVHKFTRNGMKAKDFFLKYYACSEDEKKKYEALHKQVNAYMESIRARIMERLQGKKVFEMGSDGEPTWKPLQVMPAKASVLFHFRKNEDNTHYFITIKYGGQKLDFQYRNAYLICKEPAWLVLDGRIFSFEKDVDGHKIQPFLNKKFIVVGKDYENEYYHKFIAQVVARYDVYAKGFDINTGIHTFKPILQFSPLASGSQSLFSDEKDQQANKIAFTLYFGYGPYKFRADRHDPVFVEVEETANSYVFHRISRQPQQEKAARQVLSELGMDLRGSSVVWPAGQAIDWVKHNSTALQQAGFDIHQPNQDQKQFFLGEASIEVEITENIDWFDINAIIKFGEFAIPFRQLRKLITKNKREIKLPNGQIAIIPESWFTDYADLFSFVQDDEDQPKLAKHHLALVQEAEKHKQAKVSMDRKLGRLRDFKQIEEYAVPAGFKGTLRPYQKAGYNWLMFLNQYKFGGCLADDMGLGKTVQTLALLQSEKEKGVTNASLLVMPTSLIYNWKKEAARFTPELKIYDYTGTHREKDTRLFQGYDLVITSYGIVRRDVEELAQYYFNYIILDESQAIKNPSSNISKAVRQLKSAHRLILTGTPLENSTMDLWSQMSFINPGLLGQQSFFKKRYLIPIEKQQSEAHTRKLYSIIKPFILRRHKSQVARELPEKVENVHYSSMTPEQKEVYDEVKNQYRNRILSHIEDFGVNKSQMLLLQGLTRLRQIANHPRMVDADYRGSSGKMDDLLLMMDNALAENHKILVFSQFVKHLQLVREMLDERQLDYCYLDGATKDREAQVERFQHDDEVRLFLISLKAGGLGLNLTRADYVLLLDPWWNPAVEAQAIDRAHRIGQTRKVITYKFIMSDTVEEKILDLQERKKKLARELITTDQGFVKSLTKEDIARLLA